jgi:hypothetical protein
VSGIGGAPPGVIVPLLYEVNFDLMAWQQIPIESTHFLSFMRGNQCFCADVKLKSTDVEMDIMRDGLAFNSSPVVMRCPDGLRISRMVSGACVSMYMCVCMYVCVAMPRVALLSLSSDTEAAGRGFLRITERVMGPIIFVPRCFRAPLSQAAPILVCASERQDGALQLTCLRNQSTKFEDNLGNKVWEQSYTGGKRWRGPYPTPPHYGASMICALQTDSTSYFSLLPMDLLRTLAETWNPTAECVFFVGDSSVMLVALWGPRLWEL